MIEPEKNKTVQYKDLGIKPLSAYTHIIWDWNGTILNDTIVVLKAINQVLKDNDLRDVSMEYYRDNFAWPMDEFYIGLGLYKPNEGEDFSIKVSQPYHVAYEEAYGLIKLHDKIPEILEYFQAQGKKQSVLSAREEAALKKDIENFKLGDYFEHAYGRHVDNTIGKLDRGKDLLAVLGADPRKILIFGDSCHDHEVAQALGCDVVIVHDGLTSEKALQKKSIISLPSMSDFYRLAMDQEQDS